MNNNNNPSRTAVNPAAYIKCKIRIAPASLIKPDERLKCSEVVNFDTMLLDTNTHGIIKLFELQESNIIDPKTRQKDVKIILRRIFPIDKYILSFEDR